MGLERLFGSLPGKTTQRRTTPILATQQATAPKKSVDTGCFLGAMHSLLMWPSTTSIVPIWRGR